MKSIAFSIAILFPLSAFADVFIDLADYQLWSTTNGTDVIRVVPIGASVNNTQTPTCSDADSYMVKSTLSAASINRIYSTMLAAKMASKPITIVVSGCELNRPAIVSAIIK